MLTPPVVGVGIMAAQRLVELRHARRNERAARARGALERGARHYPVIVAMHAGWLVSTLVEARRATTVRRAPLVALLAAQGLRYWAIAALGPQWTTRVLVDPNAKPVTTGPYRFLSHPNYVAVAVEIAAFPLTFGASRTAWWFSILDAAVLRHRVRVEDRARREFARGEEQDAESRSCREVPPRNTDGAFSRPDRTRSSSLDP